MAKPYKRQGSRFWYVAPMINGVQVPQSSLTTDYAAALRKLHELEGRIASGEIQTPTMDRESFASLLDAVKTDYKIRDRRSSPDLHSRIDKHISPRFGELPSRLVSTATINDYVLELAIIKRAFNLGKQSDRVSRIPHIEMLPEDNERDGYYSRERFLTLLALVNPLVASILEFAYVTGWRIGSIRRLEWHQVDLKAGFVWLNARDTKNRKAVRWPLMAGLREILELRREITSEVERRKERIVPYVFHRNGQPVKSIRTAWEKARLKAGLPGHHVHDFRGTATVNLLEAGVDIPKIMSMVGYKTIQMVERYARRRGAREESLIEAAGKLELRLGTTVKAKSTTAGATE